MYNAHQKLNQINMCRRSTKQNTLHTYVYKCTFKSPIYSIYIDTHRGAHNWYASTHARPLSGMHNVTWVTTTHWSATLTFAPCKEKANGAGAEEFFLYIFFEKQTSHDVPWLETNDKRTEMCAVWERPRYTLWRTAQNRAFCAISKRSVVKRLRFDKKIINKCEAKKHCRA